MDAREPGPPPTGPGSTAGTSTNPTLFAAGFNAHNQLNARSTKDLHTFTSILPTKHADTESVHLLFKGWSSTALITDESLLVLGWQGANIAVHPSLLPTFHSGFGDHNGFYGCLSEDGSLYTVSPIAPEILRQGDDDSPKLGLLALAGNGKVAVTFKQAANGKLAHVLQFPSLSDFWTWFNDPSVYKLDAEKQHFMLPGRPAQLLAGTGTFTLLMDGGEVYTWGDPRYRSLARDIAGAPAERPALVEALGGLKIVKIAAGGWGGAAVSEDRAGYIWGTGSPGSSGDEGVIKPLRGEGDVVLVEIHDGGEALDVLDIGVGEGFLLAVVEGGRLFGVGANRNGQLGLGDAAPEFVEDWAEVPGDRGYRHVVCGPKASFVYHDSDATP